MMMMFHVYRVLLALGLGAMAFSLAALALTRPVEMAESSGLLLAVSLAAGVLGAAALMNRRAVSVILLVCAAAAAVSYAWLQPWVSTGLAGIAGMESWALAALKPWRGRP